MAETRKLAAIPAADVAGYQQAGRCRRGADAGGLRALRSDLFDPTSTGDGAIQRERVYDGMRKAGRPEE
jgi:hypothetical protein